MTAHTKGFKKYIDCYGPDSVIAVAKFTTVDDAAPTVLESQGLASIARSGEGVFVLTFLRSWKEITVTLGTQFTTAAQTVIITGVSQSARTVTLTVVGAGGNTATDAAGMTIHVQAILRTAV